MCTWLARIRGVGSKAEKTVALDACARLYMYVYVSRDVEKDPWRNVDTLNVQTGADNREDLQGQLSALSTTRFLVVWSRKHVGSADEKVHSLDIKKLTSCFAQLLLDTQQSVLLFLATRLMRMTPSQ